MKKIYRRFMMRFIIHYLKKNYSEFVESADGEVYAWKWTKELERILKV